MTRFDKTVGVFWAIVSILAFAGAIAQFFFR